MDVLNFADVVERLRKANVLVALGSNSLLQAFGQTTFAANNSLLRPSYPSPPPVHSEMKRAQGRVHVIVPQSTYHALSLIIYGPMIARGTVPA